jgi:hypothetical protein
MPSFLWVVLIGVLVICVERGALARGGSLGYARPYQTPAENMRKSHWYDCLLSTDAGFRAYRMAKECRPIVHDPQLQGNCISPFDAYEPVRPRSGNQR